MRGHPLGDRLHSAAHDEASVVASGDEGLDDDRAAPGLATRDLKGLLDLAVRLQVQAYPSSVVSVERLDHHGVPDSLGCLDGTSRAADGRLARDGEAGRAEQGRGEILVAGDVHGQSGRLRGHRRPNPLLMDALTQLHERGVVEPDPRDVAADGLLEDRRGRRSEGRAFGAPDELVERLVEVEALLVLHEVVHDPDREPAGGQADGLVGVAVNDVVPAGMTLDATGLAARLVVAGFGLELQRDVLRDVSHPRSLVEPLDESAGMPAGALVPLQARKQLDKSVSEARNRVARVSLENAEIDDEVDGLLIGPEVRTPVDP